VLEEQLLPPTIRSELGIQTQTPLREETPAIIAAHLAASFQRTEEASQGVLRIKKDDKVIRAFLAARSLLGVRIKSKNARDVLALYAKEENLQIDCFPEKW